MDVHLRSTTVCALDAETGEAVTAAAELVRWLWALGAICREAGE